MLCISDKSTSNSRSENDGEAEADNMFTGSWTMGTIGDDEKVGIGKVSGAGELLNIGPAYTLPSIALFEWWRFRIVDVSCLYIKK